MTAVRTHPSRGWLLVLCLTSLLFAGFRPARNGAGLAPPPDQPQDVAVSRSGFVPSVIHARKGEAIHLRLTSRDQEHCFAVDAFRVESLSVEDLQLGLIEVEMFRGQLVAAPTGEAACPEGSAAWVEQVAPVQA